MLSVPRLAKTLLRASTLATTTLSSVAGIVDKANTSAAILKSKSASCNWYSCVKTAAGTDATVVTEVTSTACQ